MKEEVSSCGKLVIWTLALIVGFMVAIYVATLGAPLLLAVVIGLLTIDGAAYIIERIIVWFMILLML